MKLEVWLPLTVAACGLLGAIGLSGRDRLFPAAGPRVARIDRIEGAARSGDEVLALGATVGKGQRVDGAPGGRLVFHFPDGTRLDARGASFDLLKVMPAEVWLHRGTLRLDGSGRLFTRDATVSAGRARGEVTASDEGTVVRAARGRLHVEGLHRTSLDLAPAHRVEFLRGDPLANPPPPPATASEDSNAPRDLEGGW
ncbi:MAG: hypothetical protein EXR72_07190 [Myxococcales bacterium]|nr:hypothetical protein [Myxococcales bacterium]